MLKIEFSSALRILMAGEGSCHQDMPSFDGTYIKAVVCIYMQVGDICLLVFVFVLVFVFNQRQARRQNKKRKMDKRFNNKSQKCSEKCEGKSNQIK